MGLTYFRLWTCLKTIKVIDLFSYLEDFASMFPDIKRGAFFLNWQKIKQSLGLLQERSYSSTGQDTTVDPSWW